MTNITTKRHPVKFYVSLTFGFVFMTAIGASLIYSGNNILQKEHPEIKEYFMLFFGIAFILIAISLVHSYKKNSPKVIVDNHTLKIGQQTFYIKDIKDIELTGKMPFRFIIRFPMEGTAIIFNDDTEKILFDDMYSNSSELKLFLEQVVIKKQVYIPTVIKLTSKNEIKFENKETFKGNQFTSLRGISLWGIIGLFLFFVISSKSEPIGLLIFIAIFSSFWFIFNSWLMHYFELTNDYLVVKNHNFIWKVKIYRLSDIKEIVFETNDKQPNSMRVITNDYRNKLYPAGTLTDKTWLEMKKKLESKGTHVRNECICEEE